MNTLTLATRAQAVIFECEVKGQISDGLWENTPGTDWQTWCRTEVQVGTPVGRNMYVGKTGFALERLIEYVGDRMMRYARLALAFPNATYEDLRDLEASDRVQAIAGRAVDGYWANVQQVARRYGGQEAVAAYLNNTAYGKRELRADLKAIKAAMKQGVR